MSTPEFLADFTEDTQEPCLCNRCATVLQPGNGHLIHSHKPGQVDKLACTKCCEHYKNKPTTIWAPQRVDNNQALPDPKVIRASVSAAQSCSTVNPPLVVAMSKPAQFSSTNMPPPPGIPLPPLPRLNASHHHHNVSAQGPDVHVPSAWGPGPSISHFPASSLPPGSKGYSDQHLQYAAQHARWANAACQVPSAETISLEILAVYECTGKRRHPRTNRIGSICEGLKDVDAHSSAQELASLALKTVVPLIRMYNTEFLWRSDDFVVWDKTWVNLSAHSDVKPYFYNECLHATKAKSSKTKVFKPGSLFTLYIVIPEKHWAEYERFKEENSEGDKAPLTDSSAIVLPQAHHPNLPHSAAVTPEPMALSSGNIAMLVAPVAQTSPLPISSVSSSKHLHHHSSSVTSVSSRSPPPKQTSIFASPDCNKLKEALKAGGASEFDIAHARKQRVETIDFHPIPTVDIDYLVCEHSARAFSVKTAELFPGRVRLNVSLEALLGVGAFKTAQAAHLMLSPLRVLGIGSQPNDPIVIKRCYMHVGHEEEDYSPPFMHFSLGEEANRLHRKANILYWAKVLLKMTYDYVDHCIDHTDEPPPFEIPHLHFVDAGLLVGFSEGSLPNAGPSSGKQKSGGFSSVYLAEEVIASTGGDNKFIKFIHNRDASPHELRDPTLNEVANFLSFTQHIQYVKTGGQVFLSDYQGCPPVLTDPQILTHPDVSDGKVLFGDSNLETGVELFETQHECNKFCLWPGFGLHDSGESKSAKELSTGA